MALVLGVSTPQGLASYHAIGQEVYEDNATPHRAWCILMSYADEASVDAGAAPLAQERFDLPNWDGTTGKAVFYAYIVTLPAWAGATIVAEDTDPNPVGG